MFACDILIKVCTLRFAPELSACGGFLQDFGYKLQVWLFVGYITKQFTLASWFIPLFLACSIARLRQR